MAYLRDVQPNYNLIHKAKYLRLSDVLETYTFPFQMLKRETTIFRKKLLDFK